MTTRILRITIAHIRPPIWRRLAVPGDFTLGQLHAALQLAFGWEDSHRHEFTVGDERYGVADTDDKEMLDESEVALASVLPRKGASMQYIYDLGDCWLHTVTVEHIEETAPSGGGRSMRPRRSTTSGSCLEGARAGPPEDGGGPAGYADFLKAMDFVNHREHAQSMEWIGGKFDPELCNVASINRRLAALHAD